MDSEFINQISNLKVLYIEDDDVIRDYLEEFLKRYVKTIISVSSAEDGLIHYKKLEPDLIIVDINLPKQNGIDFIKTIRENDLKTRILISTAYTNKEFTIEAIELDITRYLVKPITSQDLIKALNKVMKELGLKPSDTIINLGEGFIFNKKTNILQKNGIPIDLRRKELELLKFFISKKENIVSYEMLEDEVWFDSVMTIDAIRSQIKNIRKKTHSSILKNVSGIGYKLYNGLDNA